MANTKKLDRAKKLKLGSRKRVNAAPLHSPSEQSIRNLSRISPKQRHLLELFANPADTRDVKDKAAEVGIAASTAWRWQLCPWWKPELLSRQMVYIGTLATKAIQMAELLLEHGSEESKCKMVVAIFKAARAFPGEGINLSQVTNVTNTSLRETVAKHRAERGLAPLTD